MITRINGYPISAGFGDIDSVHKIPHKGVDIAMPEGTPLSAIGNGVVSRINDEGAASFGKSVRIELEDGTEVIYGHLSRINVEPGDVVHAGDIVGLSGNTGHSTGPHLHLQMVAENGALIDPTPKATDGTVWQWVAKNVWPDSWKGPLFNMVDANPGTTIWTPIGRWFTGQFDALITLLNANAPEIVTTLVIICGFGMILSPMIGGKGSAWLGRTVAVIFLGGLWCAII